MAAKYELQHLPKLGNDKNKDPFEFMYQFDSFLRYINLDITSPAKVENAIQLFGSCMYKKLEAILKFILAQHQQMKKVLKYKEQLLNGTKSKQTL